MEYSKEIQKVLQKNSIEIGHRISVEKDKQIYEGLLMPKSSGDPNIIIIKLDNGYNVGIDFSGARIRKLKGEMIKKVQKMEKCKPDPSKKMITILHTGGTVASKVDYETGGVTTALTPEDLYLSIPELRQIANFKIRKVFQMWSQDMEIEHWIELTKVIKEEIDKGADGIIITHGTDLLHYTSAALSFALQNLPIPVMLVGSQRSSDRGSADSALNMICAAQFIEKSDFAGVGICMHATTNDDFCYISDPVNVRKMHTTRRDTFRCIDVYPIAKVDKEGNIEFFRAYTKSSGSLKVSAIFEKNVAILKSRPGFSYKELEAYEKMGFKGLVIDSTGLGHLPNNVTDKYTEQHKKLNETITRLTKKGIMILITSQCPYGRVNMDVYADQRILVDAGIIPVAMTTETAFVKLSWVLGHTKDPSKAKKMLQTNYVGEIVEKIDPRVFLF
jgi:glutamyl-tRNA(Gln) amidotransferase subunit D